MWLNFWGLGQEDADNDGIGDACDPDGIAIDLKDYTAPIWDFSGNYEQFLDNATLAYTLAQDSKGKLTGSGKFETSDNSTTIDVEVKGKVKGNKGTVSVKYTVKGKNDAKDKVQNKLKLELSDNETTLDGTQKGKICGKGAKCEKFEDPAVSLPVADDMTGEALVVIETTVDEKGKKLEGDAELILSNGDEYFVPAKGKINDNKGETKYQVKGDNETTKGIKFKITMDDAADNATKINGKAFGQQLKYKQE